MYSLYQRDEQNGKIWYLAAQKDEPGEPEKPVPPVVPEDKTTPSTDAVLSMAAAPQLIFNHELDNLRFRRGELRDNQGDAGVWVRLTGDRTRAGTGHTHFKLNQAGFEAWVRINPSRWKTANYGSASLPAITMSN